MTERQRLTEELEGLKDQLNRLKETTEDKEKVATINNILTPIHFALEDIIEPEGKSNARYVIREVKQRIESLTTKNNAQISSP